MKKFNYTAKNKANNEVVHSVVQAESENAAGRLLIEQGLMPLNITELDENGSIIAKLTNRITVKDRIVFLRQLATLIGAGLPLSQSLHTVIDQTTNKKMRQVIEELIASIEGGHTLSDSMRKRPEIFDAIVVALVEAGEASGTLDQALSRIALQKEKDAAMMGKIKGAMVYPAIVLLVIIVVMVFMLLTVMPQVAKLYSDMKKELPALTQIMNTAADFLVNYWWAAILVLVVGGYFIMQYLKTEAGSKMMDGFKLNVPLFKGMFRKLYMARFTRTGQTLLSTGVAMLDMLEIAGEGLNNSIVKASIDRASEKVKGGKALSEAIKPEDYILVMVPQMISIGEKSGKIDEMMGKTAQIYEDEWDEEIRTISTAIEPILMVVLAVVAGGMVGAILFPIYSLVGGV